MDEVYASPYRISAHSILQFTQAGLFKPCGIQRVDEAEFFNYFINQILDHPVAMAEFSTCYVVSTHRASELLSRGTFIA